MTLPVSQEARDAAAEFYGQHLSRPNEVLVTAHMRAGKIDESPLIQAFARFEAQTLERAAKACEEQSLDFGDPEYAGPKLINSILDKRWAETRRDLDFLDLPWRV